MPIYEYISTSEGCAVCEQPFEVLQGINDDPMTRCEACQQPLRRVVSSFGVAKSSRVDLSDGSLAKKGFTRYEKAGDGVYEKTAGDGPKQIHR